MAVACEKDRPPSSTFRITILLKVHTCCRLVKRPIQKRTTVKWISNFIKARLEDGACYKTAEDVVKDLKARSGIHVTINKPGWLQCYLQGCWKNNLTVTIH